jgi:hypothetical protein
MKPARALIREVRVWAFVFLLIVALSLAVRWFF